MARRAVVGTTVDDGEVLRFAKLAEDWWDERGSMGVLHAMNPARLGFIRDRIAAAHGRAPEAARPLAGLKVLDVGCGGGIAAEPLARLGAAVTGIDAGAELIGIARAHAAARGIDIDYRCLTAEALAASGARFDAVVALEIVEHVADADAFVGALAALARPGAPVILSTLNRTLASLGVAVIGAEWILRLLPRGTHDWRKFLKPSELAALLRRRGVGLDRVAGLIWDPRDDAWRLSEHALGVNYILAGRKASEAKRQSARNKP